MSHPSYALPFFAVVVVLAAFAVGAEPTGTPTAGAVVVAGGPDVGAGAMGVATTGVGTAADLLLVFPFVFAGAHTHVSAAGEGVVPKGQGVHALDPGPGA